MRAVEGQTEDGHLVKFLHRHIRLSLGRNCRKTCTVLFPAKFGMPIHSVILWISSEFKYIHLANK